jgi:hypothetical protein
MSQFVKVTDTLGNTVFLNPRHVISVTQSGQTVDILLPSSAVVTVETTAEKIVDQLSVVLS